MAERSLNFEIELRLASEKIVDSIANQKRGRNPSYILELESGIKAVFKATPHWRDEMAAYVVSRDVGFGIVPEMAPRTIGQPGIISRFVEFDKIGCSPEQLDLVRTFSWLIYGGPETTLIARDGRLFVFDNEGSFAPLASPQCPKCGGNLNPKLKWNTQDWNVYTSVITDYRCPYPSCSRTLETPHLAGLHCDYVFSIFADHVLRFVQTEESKRVLAIVDADAIEHQLASFLPIARRKEFLLRLQALIRLSKMEPKGGPSPSSA